MLHDRVLRVVLSAIISLSYVTFTYMSSHMSCPLIFCCFFFFKQKTAYEMRISDWSSDVCSSDLVAQLVGVVAIGRRGTGAGVAGHAEALHRSFDQVAD